MGVAGMSGFRRIWRLTPRVGAIAAGACYRRGCGPDWPAEWVACWRRLVSRAARGPRMGRGRSRPRRRSCLAVSRCGEGIMPGVAFSLSARVLGACRGRVRFSRPCRPPARAAGPVSEARLPGPIDAAARTVKLTGDGVPAGHCSVAIVSGAAGRSNRSAARCRAVPAREPWQHFSSRLMAFGTSDPAPLTWPAGIKTSVSIHEGGGHASA